MGNKLEGQNFKPVNSKPRMSDQEPSDEETDAGSAAIKSECAANRVALLTAPGVAAIAVVRLSGPLVEAFLARHFSKPVVVGRPVHGDLRDGDRVIDDAIAVRFTDVLDLNLHGGSWVVRSVLMLAQSHGFELSDLRSTDGESEIWNEVLAALPLAATEQAVRMLLAQPVAWESIVDRAAVLADPSGRWLVQMPRVAIVGPANVGKSTLANQLFGQARSITADIPGTTRDWVGEIANLDGLAVMLVDTPGIRLIPDTIEAAAIAGSAEQIRNADLVLLVLDQSLPLDRAMLAAYPDAIRVANKSDAPPSWDAAGIGAVRTSAVFGRGMDTLRVAVRHRFGWEPMDLNQARWWNARQCDALEKP
jgi:small GTP-binding protein